MILYPWAIRIMLNNSLVKFIEIKREWSPNMESMGWAINMEHESIHIFYSYESAKKDADLFVNSLDPKWRELSFGHRRTAYVIPIDESSDGNSLSEFATGDDFY